MHPDRRRAPIRLSALALPPILLVLAGVVGLSAQPVAPPPAASPLRFEQDILAFEAADRVAAPAPGGIIFVGSSIFRLWSGLTEHMAPLPVVNRAFGGSRTADQLHYLSRIVAPHRPRVVVYYCGSNDVNAQVPAATIADNAIAFSTRLRALLPATRVVYVSIIKAPQKRDRWHVVEEANALVRAYALRTPGHRYVDVNPALQDTSGEPLMRVYLPDQLHYRPEAYDRLAAVVRPAVEAAWAASAPRP